MGATIVGLGVRLLRRLRVSRAGSDDPHDAAVLVRAVPDPAAGGDFVLPLLESAAPDLPGGELITQAVLTLGVLRAGGPLGKYDPGFPRIAARDPAEFLPAFGGLGGREPGLPTAGPSRRGNPLAALSWQESDAFRSRHRTEVVVERSRQLLDQCGVGVDRGGGLPLDDHLRDYRPVA